MSGDLEDFLRRAAQRRQAKAAQPQQQPAKPVQRPQYSDRRTERIVPAIEVDEVLTAEIVEEDTDSLAARQRRLAESKKRAAQAEALAAEKMGKVKRGRAAPTAQGVPLSGIPAVDLRRLLSHPSGIRQAILLREVLDRPEHRW